MDFNQIILGCRRKDRSCQKQLYDLHYAYGIKIALSYSNNIDDASEVLNDAFFDVFEKIDQYDINHSFTSWFRIIVIRKAINYYHKNIKYYNAEKSQELFDSLDTQGDNAICDIDAEELLNFVNQLPPAYRMVLNLYAIEGYSHQEIAKMLTISTGTSKSNLSKARLFLKKLMSEIKIFTLF
ncbi:MAG: RNA polymerase sigma factor [Saprospiraceae bacterium]|jgi:RNA polymerase sigma-70 factor (ECF subfamily)|nr:RNA polymerase sigma factor [Saprospiraceae bacterium]MCB9308428.1 RNA polymerase sigma factor [Lewinellaceae bacterium]